MLIKCKNPNKKSDLCKVCERAKGKGDKSNVYNPVMGKDACNGFIYYPIKKSKV